jgi:hypothetical protein
MGTGVALNCVSVNAPLTDTVPEILTGCVTPEPSTTTGLALNCVSVKLLVVTVPVIVVEDKDTGTALALNWESVNPLVVTVPVIVVDVNDTGTAVALNCASVNAKVEDIDTGTVPDIPTVPLIGTALALN